MDQKEDKDENDADDPENSPGNQEHANFLEDPHAVHKGWLGHKEQPFHKHKEIGNQDAYGKQRVPIAGVFEFFLDLHHNG